MSDRSPLILQILATAIPVARKAGDIIRNVRNLNVIDKGKNDFQTEADRSSQRCIVTNLKKRFPDVTVIAEENIDDSQKLPSEWVVDEQDQIALSTKCPTKYLHVRPEELIVWVDPLDGTSDFIKGRLEYVTVLIGISVNGEAVAGVVHQPYHDPKADEVSAAGRTVWGIKDLGLFGMATPDPPLDKFVAVATYSTKDKIANMTLDAIKPDEVERVGSAGHGVLTILEGKGHVAVPITPSPFKWDMCALEALLEAYGGHMLNISGKHYNYCLEEPHSLDDGLLLIAKGVDVAEYLVKLPKEVVSAFPVKK